MTEITDEQLGFWTCSNDKRLAATALELGIARRRIKELEADRDWIIRSVTGREWSRIGIIYGDISEVPDLIRAARKETL